MKKIIVVLVATIITAGILIGVNFHNSHRFGYIYERGPYNAITGHYSWIGTGDCLSYTIDELRDLAKDCSRVSICDYGPDGFAIGFTLSEDRVMIVEGLSLDDDISETYYMTF